MTSYSLSLDRFVGKVAVVTGASSGIGKAIAELLVRRGVVVAGVARRAERISENAQKLKNEKGKLQAFQADLTKPDEIIAVFKKIGSELGAIHVLVNNAGLMLSSNIIDGDIDKWKTVLDTNILGATVCIREAIANMKRHNVKGHIININSILGHQVIDFPGLNVYPASKFAITGLTETVRLEINREKLPIKITSLSPGYVKTEFVDVAYGGAPSEEINQMPGLESQDIADAALYILSTPEHVNVKELTVSVQGY